MIKLKNISAGYNKVKVIKNINIAFEEGSITSIIGKNGCGKTTLLKTSLSLIKPFSGEITVNNMDILSFPNKELAKKVAYLPQIRAVPNITVYDLVMHGRFPYLGFSRIPKEKDKEIVKKSIESLNLNNMINKNVQELSGGQRQKTYLAMVLAQDTDIIFLDEPTTYLDINHQLEILEIVRKLKNMGKTVIMVLHDLSSALSYSDKICLMDSGEIVAYDTPQAVFDSKQINRIFNVNSEQVSVENNDLKQYIFYLIKD